MERDPTGATGGQREAVGKGSIFPCIPSAGLTADSEDTFFPNIHMDGPRGTATVSAISIL